MSQKKQLEYLLKIKTNMSFKKNQNRREFLKNSARYFTLGGVSFLGIKLAADSIKSGSDPACEVNLPCRNCFKLGGCNEVKAVKMREEIKTDAKAKPSSSGGNND